MIAFTALVTVAMRTSLSMSAVCVLLADADDAVADELLSLF